MEEKKGGKKNNGGKGGGWNAKDNEDVDWWVGRRTLKGGLRGVGMSVEIGCWGDVDEERKGGRRGDVRAC